jgi:hypothetical protein
VEAERDAEEHAARPARRLHDLKLERARAGTDAAQLPQRLVGQLSAPYGNPHLRLADAELAALAHADLHVALLDDAISALEATITPTAPPASEPTANVTTNAEAPRRRGGRQ